MQAGRRPGASTACPFDNPTTPSKLIVQNCTNSPGASPACPGRCARGWPCRSGPPTAGARGAEEAQQVVRGHPARSRLCQTAPGRLSTQASNCYHPPPNPAAWPAQALVATELPSTSSTTASPAHLHDHAQVLVVEDEALGVELLHRRGRQLLAVHDEAAAGGRGEIRAAISWESVARRAQPQAVHGTDINQLGDRCKFQRAAQPSSRASSPPRPAALRAQTACLPSPSMSTTIFLGRPFLPSKAAAAPRAEGRPKPMLPRPPEVTHRRGSRFL